MTTVRTKIPISLLTLACITFMGCDKRVSVGGDYQIIQPQTYLIDSGRPACPLYYKGKSVWPSVLVSLDQSYHDGYFVFLAAVPDETGTNNDYGITPQLYAIRAAGPPVIISQRLFNRSLTNWADLYTVENITSVPNGFSVEFEYHDAEIQTNLEVTWPQIQSWVQEAETSAPVRVTPLGSYRILPMQRPGSAQQPAPTAP